MSRIRGNMETAILPGTKNPLYILKKIRLRNRAEITLINMMRILRKNLFCAVENWVDTLR